MKLSNGIYRPKGLKRFTQISKVLIKYGFGEIVNRLFSRKGKYQKQVAVKEASLKPDDTSPIRLRLALEELGPSFIKLGQLMSTRADIFPPDYIEELKKLQDHVPPVPYDDIKNVVESELKEPVDAIFAEFSTEPMAAASVAQVHSAILKNGEPVAVKVIRPGIDKIIREDIRLMHYFAEKIENAFEIGKSIGAVNLVKEFERTVFKEMDMHIEAGTIEKFTANFHESEEIKIPKVWWDHISRSVLVMERIDGIKMDQVDKLKENDIDPREISMIGLRSFSSQLFEFGLFHADPHPANVIVLYDGRVSLVDFGIIGYLDEEVMLQIANLFLGYAEHDYDMIMNALMDAKLVNDETMDVESFRVDLKDMSEQFYGRTLKTISVRDVYDQVMQLVLKYHIRMPRNLLLLLKTIIQTEALGKILDSDASLLEVTRPYARKLILRGYEARKVLRNMESNVRTLSGYFRIMPKMVHDILRQMASGKHRIELRHTGFEHWDTKLEKGLNRMIVGIITSASIIAGSLILNSSEKIMEVEIRFFGVHQIPLTGLLGVTGYTIATILGVWLIICIMRSGKM